MLTLLFNQIVDFAAIRVDKLGTSPVLVRMIVTNRILVEHCTSAGLVLDCGHINRVDKPINV